MSVLIFLFKEPWKIMVLGLLGILVSAMLYMLGIKNLNTFTEVAQEDQLRLLIILSIFLLPQAQLLCLLAR
ncbi:MAG: hypothetical protein GDA42_01390 [Ekhidna sp.]|nr:hypothetical protein [Ekhidna sp.]